MSKRIDTSLRIIKLVELDYERLYDEVKGKPADVITNQPSILPARPELEIFTVGVVQSTQEVIDEREEEPEKIEIIVESKVCKQAIAIHVPKLPLH